MLRIKELLELEELIMLVPMNAFMDDRYYFVEPIFLMKENIWVYQYGTGANGTLAVSVHALFANTSTLASLKYVRPKMPSGSGA
jgi:hypothetical protein